MTHTDVTRDPFGVITLPFNRDVYGYEDIGRSARPYFTLPEIRAWYERLSKAGWVAELRSLDNPGDGVYCMYFANKRTDKMPSVLYFHPIGQFMNGHGLYEMTEKTPFEYVPR